MIAIRVASVVLAIGTLASLVATTEVTCYSDNRCKTAGDPVAVNAPIHGCGSYKVTGGSIRSCLGWANGACVHCEIVGVGCWWQSNLGCWTR